LPSVSSSSTSRSADVVRPPSTSVPVTTNFHSPSVLGCPFQVTVCRPGCSVSCASISCAPPGPVSVAVTCDGATTLYVNVSVSSTPSPFGETTSVDGGAAYTPVYESSSASPIGCSTFFEGRVSSV